MNSRNNASACIVIALAALSCLLLTLILQAAIGQDDRACNGDRACNAAITEPQVAPRPAGALVRRVQVALSQRHYYTGPVDGDLGQWTQQALYTFQHGKRLSETGSIDIATLQNLAIPVPSWMAGSTTSIQDVP